MLVIVRCLPLLVPLCTGVFVFGPGFMVSFRMSRL